MKQKIAIIGGGAAGFFCAIHIKRQRPDVEVCIIESKSKPLTKVAITGGGRCNLTNSFRDIINLKDVYPRGDKLMKRALMQFSHVDTYKWFEAEGVPLVTQDDQCVFPQSQSAMHIVDILTRNAKKLGVHSKFDNKIDRIEHDGQLFTITNRFGEQSKWHKVVITTGGHPTPKGFEMLRPLGVNIVQPVPSLFTLTTQGEWHQELMGIVVENVVVGITATKFKSQGALLHTHWGMSGPAILKLSSYAARHLKEQHYRCKIAINWFGNCKEDELRGIISSIAENNRQKQITSVYPHHLTSRHWAFLTKRACISSTTRWGALNGKQMNRLVATLTADTYEVAGKYPHKDEFVTCGGVSLKEIDINTLQHKKINGLFFAGEVLDIDAVTGGFNLQAAWSTAYVVAKNIYS